jgi:hypothetical protein
VASLLSSPYRPAAAPKKKTIAGAQLSLSKNTQKSVKISFLSALGGITVSRYTLSVLKPLLKP